MKIKIEIEVDISDKAGYDFVDSVHNNFNNKDSGNQVIQRLAEYAKKRPMVITTCSYIDDSKPIYGLNNMPARYIGNKEVAIKIIS